MYREAKMMINPTQSSDGSGSNSGRTCRLLLLFWLTTFLAAIGIGVVATIIVFSVPPNRIDEEFLSRYTVIPYYFYDGQPAKTLSFDIGVVLAVPVIFISIFISRALLQKLNDALLPLAVRFAIGVMWLTFLVCILPVFYCPNPPYPELPPGRLLFQWYWHAHPLPWWVYLLTLSFAISSYLYLWKRDSIRKYLNAILAALVLVWMLMVPLEFYSPSDFNDELRYTYHFNVIMDALSQVSNGRHVLVQFPHMYGCYIELLGPFLSALPRRLEILLAVFPLINAFAVLSLLLTARLVIENPLFLFLTGSGLLALEYITTSYDHYYSYSAIRLLFPALGILVSAVYLRWPSRSKYALASFVAALSTVWNLDTGIALWVSWTVTMIIIGLSERGWRRGFQNLFAQFGSLIAIWAIFILYLKVESGHWPRFEMLLVFQKMVLSSGYVCLPMIFPDVWTLDLLVYGSSLSIALILYLQKPQTWRVHFILMLSLLGIGLFQYYIGRSAVSNLITVSYPVLIVLGMLLDQTLSMINTGQLPRATWAMILPATLMLSYWAILLPLALPSLLLESAENLQELRFPITSPLDINAAFVAEQSTPKEEIYLLSNQSGAYYYLSNTVSPLSCPGTVELLLKKDMDFLISAIESERIQKLFVDQDFFNIPMYKPDVYLRLHQAIAQHYLLQATSRTGQIALYLPR